MRAIAQLAAAVIAVGAGVYLLQYSGASINIGNGASGRSWFDIIDHGIGAYFVARGIWMFTQISELDDVVVSLRRLVELREWEVAQMIEEDDADA